MNTSVSSGYGVDSSTGRLYCNKHPVSQQFWCEHLKGWIEKGGDAAGIAPPERVQVPVFPTNTVWVEVELGDPIPSGSALMTLEYQPDFGKMKRIPLGFWNPGEGRSSIRAVILDYLKSRCDPAEDFRSPEIKTHCPAKTHGFAQQRELHKDHSVAWKLICLWNIVMEGACSPCIDQSDDFGPDPDLQTLGPSPIPPWKKH